MALWFNIFFVFDIIYLVSIGLKDNKVKYKVFALCILVFKVLFLFGKPCTLIACGLNFAFTSSLGLIADKYLILS